MEIEKNSKSEKAVELQTQVPCFFNEALIFNLGTCLCVYVPICDVQPATYSIMTFAQVENLISHVEGLKTEAHQVQLVRNSEMQEVEHLRKVVMPLPVPCQFPVTLSLIIGDVRFIVRRSKNCTNMRASSKFS